MPTSRPRAAELVTSGFVVLRAPALPFDRLLGGPVQTTPQFDAVSPEVREAIYLASPGLVEQLIRQSGDGTSRRASAAGRSLSRYLTRMAFRPTPFGLLAGFSLGTVASATRLTIPAGGIRRLRHAAVARLEAMLREVGAASRFRRVVPFRVNPGLHRVGDRLHCPQGLSSSTGYDCVVLSIQPEEPLDQLLTAAEPATLEVWTNRLRRLAPSIRARAAGRIIAELLDAELLVPALNLPVTAPNPFRQVVTRLERDPPTRPLAQRLRAVTRSLDRMNRHSAPVSPSRYGPLARQLATLPGGSEDAVCFQADLVMGGEVTLGRGVVLEVARAIEWLHRWAGAGPPRSGLDRFRRAFRERYQDRAVPLLTVLDEEAGIGLPMDQPRPMLDPATDSRFQLLLPRLAAAWRARDLVLPMAWDDPDRLPTPTAPLSLPDALAAVGSLAAVSASAIDRGEYLFRLRAVRGPSGAELLGRLASVDPLLADRVRQHLRAEEALDPEAIFAEVVHLPSPAMAPIQCRPALRPHEIVLIGQPGVPPARRISLADLLVSVPPPGDRVHLWSARLGRRVNPRLTTAHDFTRDAWLPYKFLGLVQRDGVASAPEWEWGGIEAPFLPRVVLGKVVLAPARWQLSGERVAAWRKLPESERVTAIHRWRAEWNPPRFVVLLQPESEFIVDLDDPAAIAVLLDSATKRAEGDITLEELFPDPDTMPVSGPEGRFAHDLVIPFIRQRAVSKRRGRPVRPRTRRRFGTPELSRRTFLPGSECLYLKLYCGSAAADRVLVEGIGPLVEHLAQSGSVNRWFFLRYADPDTHLRLRLFGSPQRLTAEALPEAHAMAASLLERCVLRRMTLDTYDREVERYGGPRGIALVEKAFAADSAAVLTLLAQAGEAVDSVERLRLAVLGVDRLLRDFGLPVSRRLGIVTGMIARAPDGETEGLWEREAGQRFRDDRLLLENRAGSAAFRQRSRALRPLAQRIRSLHTTGRLCLTMDSLIADLVHLHCNRLQRSATQGEEAVVLRWLARLYRSKLARTH